LIGHVSCLCLTHVACCQQDAFVEQDAYVESQGNPFFSDDFHSPPALESDLCISQESSWAAGAVPQQDVLARGPHPSPLSQHQYTESVRYGQTIQTPTSQSHASTSPGSPHNGAQLDIFGASMAAQHAWQQLGTQQPPGNEGHMFPGNGQVTFPAEDPWASTYPVGSRTLVYVNLQQSHSVCWRN
jgi:hypothetical protein